MTITTHNEYPKRLIEVDLPIARISAHARREKSIRHGHISTLHIWWARRPLAACRAVICASLWPDPVDLTAWGERGEEVPVGDGSVVIRPKRFLNTARERMMDWANNHLKKVSVESSSRFIALQKGAKTLADPLDLQRVLLDFIADFANWDNSTDKDYLATARALTQAAHEALGGEPETRPLVVDPFCGGGAIPLEALRIGADAFASDLNPIPVLLNKVVLEYIPKYGQRLADEVRKWGAWIKQEAEQELAEFYPKDPDGATPIAYLWARTIQCEGPGCGAEVPLVRSLWLAKKGKRSIALKLIVDSKSKGIAIEVVENVKASNVKTGTTSGGAVTCPVCGFTTPVERVRAQMCVQQGGSNNARLVVVITTNEDNAGRTYRLPNEIDFKAVQKAKTTLNHISSFPTERWSRVPNEPLNHLRGFFNVVLYGMKTWGDLFSARQVLTLVILCDLIEKIPDHVHKKTQKDLIEAVQVCMALSLGKQADRNSAVCRWINQNEAIGYTFGRQALPMNWDFIEMSPLRSSGAWSGIIRDTIEVLESQHIEGCEGTSVQSAASDVPLPDDSANLLFTDPPYYAAVPYADLSDFFYVWIKRVLSKTLPNLFREPLAPKGQECVALSHRAAMYRNKDNQWFEARMGEACNRARVITKPTGIGCFVFANKETAGWEAMLSAIIENGWIVTASWPIDTERPGRLRAQNSAALASSIHIVCRPRENPDGSLQENVGDWRDVLSELPQRIHEWMPRLAEEGVVGADAIFACLGPALEVFSRYSRVEKSSGEAVTLGEYLEHVWAAVSKEALSMIFKDPDTAGLEPDARLTAMWLWTLGASSSNASADDSEESEDEDSDEEAGKAAKVSGFTLEFDAARKIAQGLGVHLEKAASVVEVKGDTAKLLSVAERVKYLFGKDAETAVTGKTQRKKKGPAQQSLFAELEAAESAAQAEWGDVKGPKPGTTVLDRLHQAMVLFAAGRGEAMKRFIVEEGIGNDARFWKLAQSLTALYPGGSDEKRWVDGVLARKKGLGF
jgi:adenine-specific DNA methylase